MSWLQNLPQRYRVASDPLRTERQLELLLLVMAGLLGLVLLYGILRLALLSAPDTVLPAEDSLQVGSIAPRFQPEAADSQEIRSRPLFWAGRRPYQAVVEAAPEPEADTKSQELKGVKLVGVFGVGDSAGIIVQGKNGKQRLLVGDEVGGWALTSVNPNEVKLTRRGETRSMVLKQQAIVARVETEDGDAAPKPKAKGASKPAQSARGFNSAAKIQADADNDDVLRPGGSIRLPNKKK